MNNDDFRKNLDTVHEKVETVLGAKGEEYATDNDRLHNFKVAAQVQGITNKEALSGMMAKHTFSVYDMIADGKDHSQEKWDEKILDHINYLILLRALVVEEKAELARVKKIDVNSLYPQPVGSILVPDETGEFIKIQKPIEHKTVIPDNGEDVEKGIGGHFNGN